MLPHPSRSIGNDLINSKRPSNCESRLVELHVHVQVIIPRPLGQATYKYVAKSASDHPDF